MLKDFLPLAPGANDETDTILFCQTKIPFMERDLPIPEASFELELGKLYPAPSSEGHISVEVPELARNLIANEEKIVYDLVVLGSEIVRARKKMGEDRAAVRARRVVEGWCHGVRREEKEARESRQWEERRGGEEWYTRQMRKRVVPQTEDLAESRNCICESDEEADEQEEEEADEDDVTKDGNWTPEREWIGIRFMGLLPRYLVNFVYLPRELG